MDISMQVIPGLFAFILSKPSLNLCSYPFGLPRSEHEFLTARLFNIKARPVLRPFLSRFLNFSRRPARPSSEGRRSEAVLLKI
jgi:hypothetical protein